MNSPQFFILAGTSAIVAGITQPPVLSSHVHPQLIPMAGVTVGCVALVGVVGILLDDLLAEFLDIKSSSITVVSAVNLLTLLIASVAAFAGASNWLALKLIGGTVLVVVVAGIALLIHVKRGAADEQHDQNFYN